MPPPNPVVELRPLPSTVLLRTLNWVVLDVELMPAPCDLALFPFVVVVAPTVLPTTSRVPLSTLTPPPPPFGAWLSVTVLYSTQALLLLEGGNAVANGRATWTLQVEPEVEFTWIPPPVLNTAELAVLPLTVSFATTSPPPSSSMPTPTRAAVLPEIVTPAAAVFPPKVPGALPKGVLM